jgi:hypothetical protein
MKHVWPTWPDPAVILATNSGTMVAREVRAEREATTVSTPPSGRSVE